MFTWRSPLLNVDLLTPTAGRRPPTAPPPAARLEPRKIASDLLASLEELAGPGYRELCEALVPKARFPGADIDMLVRTAELVELRIRALEEWSLPWYKPMLQGSVHQDAKFDNFLVAEADGAVHMVDYQLAVARGCPNTSCAGYDPPFYFASKWNAELARSDVFTAPRAGGTRISAHQWIAVPPLCLLPAASCPPQETRGAGTQG